MLSKRLIFHNKVSVAILLFILGFSLVHYVKPSLFYTSEGGFREFGVGYKNKTVLPIWIFAIVWAILSYLVVSYYVLLG
jgi:hypothetical protein